MGKLRVVSRHQTYKTARACEQAYFRAQAAAWQEADLGGPAHTHLRDLGVPLEGALVVRHERFRRLKWIVGTPA